MKPGARAPRVRRTTRQHDTDAVVLRRVDYGEADVLLHLYTEGIGRLTAIAPSARRSHRRFGGALEPLHTLRMRLEEREGSEMVTLREASIAVARLRIMAHLDRIEAAARVLGWVRRAVAPRVREPEIWSMLVCVLDRLDQSPPGQRVEHLVAQAGLRFMAVCGWGFELHSCVVCGKECGDGQAASIDPTRGGLICRACGGASTLLSAARRERLSAASAGDAGALLPDDAGLALDLVEQGLRAHLGLEE